MIRAGARFAALLLAVAACASDRASPAAVSNGALDPSCDEPCPEGETRVVDEEGIVRCEPIQPPECEVSEDCPVGTVCEDGCCVEPPECDNDTDCPEGELCVEGECIPWTCASNEDCPEGELCIDGDCVPGDCDDDTDCPAGWHCSLEEPFFGGTCVPPSCEACPPGFICIDGACHEPPIPCDDLSCPTGVCRDGRCVPCSEDAECPNGRCEGGVCVTVCAKAVACDGDALCEAVACEPVPDPTPVPDAGPGPAPVPDPVPVPIPVPAMSRAAGASATVATTRRVCKDKEKKPDPPKDGKKYSGTLTIWVIRPASNLWWGTPNELLASTIVAYGAAAYLVHSGQAVLGHPIGHLHEELKCTSDDGTHTIEIPLTGQTGGGNEWVGALDGVGPMLRDYKGWLDHQGPLYDKVKNDVATRKQSGKIAGMRFKLNDALCRHLWGYFDWYDRSGAAKHFGGQFRPRRLEGSGCTAFGVSFVDVGGFLGRAFMVDTWARQLFIGKNRIAKLFRPHSYPYGSNLVAWNAQGFQAWPKNQVVPAVATAIFPFAEILSRWFDPKEVQVPLTLYDTELIHGWIHKVWANLNGGGADPMWKIDKDPGNGKARVIIADFSCDKREKLPPYRDPEDDLRK